jgi:hypothetical protein
VPWDVVYYRNAAGTVPAVDFLETCPVAVEARMLAVLDAVAAAPPPRFSGGGYWEAMHGDMAGHYEVRVTGPGREQFRLFCLLDRDGPGLPGPAIAVITGLRKPWRTVFTEADYLRVRSLGDDYRQCDPRRIAT